MNQNKFDAFLLTLNENSNIAELQNNLKDLTQDFKDYFYFNNLTTAWHMSNKQQATTLSFDFSFFIPKVNSKETIEVICESSIYGKKSYGKIRHDSSTIPQFKIKTINIEPFNCAAMMYEIKPQYQEIYEKLNTDDCFLQFDQKEIKSYTKAEQFTEYVNKVRNEHVLPYLIEKFEHDLVEVTMGTQPIEMHVKKIDRIKFIKAVSNSFTDLINGILYPENTTFEPVIKALNEHDSKNRAQLLEIELPDKNTSKRFKKI